MPDGKDISMKYLKSKKKEKLMKKSFKTIEK